MWKLLAVLCFVATASIAAPKSEDEFLRKFKAAVAAHDPKLLVSLCCLDDVPKFVKKELLAEFAEVASRTIATATISDILPGKRAQMEAGHSYKGKRLVNNIPLVKQLVVAFEKDSDPKAYELTGVTLPLGKKGEEWFIAATKLID